MYTRTAFLLVFLVLAARPAAGQPLPEVDARSPLQGTWERVSARVIHPDRTYEEQYPPGKRLMKILTRKHFAFGQQSEDGQEAYAAGGEYVLDGGTYTETFTYHVSPDMYGKTIRFDCKLENDVWQISGIIGRYRLEETWHRIE